MEKVQEQTANIQGTGVSYRAYIDPSGKEKPVLVVEGSNKGIPLEKNREAVAKELSARMGRTADQVTFLEQASDGSLQETSFSKSYIQTILPNAYDLPRNEAERAEQKGEIASAKIQRYNMETFKADRGEIEKTVGEPLEPAEIRQKKQFAHWTGPQRNVESEPER